MEPHDGKFAYAEQPGFTETILSVEQRPFRREQNGVGEIGVQDTSGFVSKLLKRGRIGVEPAVSLLQEVGKGMERKEFHLTGPGRFPQILDTVKEPLLFVPWLWKTNIVSLWLLSFHRDIPFRL